MKNRIKTIRQLDAEKKQLLHRREELEKAMHYDWIDLKNTAHIKTTTRSLFEKKGEPEENQKYNSIVIDAVSRLAAKFAGKLTGNTMNKLKSWFKK
jgi:hypothetical protein